METRVLEMIFINAGGKKATISVNDPRTDLTETEVRTAMQTIIAKNAFNTTAGDLVAVSEARVITKVLNQTYED